MPGLGEKDRMALYNAGTIQVLSKGEALLKRTQRAPGISLVLNGTIDVLTTGGGLNGLSFRQGDLINEQTLFESDPSISALTAGEPSRALVLSKAAFSALSPTIQIAALKHIGTVYSSQMLDLGKNLESTRLQRASLTNYLMGEFGKHNKQYEQSELILNLMKRIPRLPIHVTQLIELLLSDNASAKHVTELAKQDPSLVGEVLKEVNSVQYGSRQKISDLHYAIMLIGFNEVYQLLVSKGIRKTMPDTEEFRNIHQHSMVLSWLSAEVCRLCDRHSVSLLSTIGLLHDIGKSTVLLIEKENPKLAFFIQLLDPCKIGSMLLEKWNLPEVICETIEYQSFARFSHPSELPSQFRKHIGILHISHAMSDWILEKTLSAGAYPFLDDYKMVCGLGDKSLDQIYEAVVKSLRTKANMVPAELKKFVLVNP